MNATLLTVPSTSRDVSVIVPVYDEAECIGGTLDELFGVLEELDLDYEVLAIDDGSTDATPAILAGMQRNYSRLRVLTLTPNSGQSAAFGAGFRHARGRAVVLMDADGQNDPADIPRLLATLRHQDACCGIRTQRRDTWTKRLGSVIANRVRSRFLGDGIIDTGCSLKAIRAELVRDLPMHLKGMHRFIPALLQLLHGARVAQIPVNHRPRAAGKSKYTNFGRLRGTIADLRAVRWMQKRHQRFDVREEPAQRHVFLSGAEISWQKTRTQLSAIRGR
jgi:dolichol-phosphate mannosyltransferase